MKDERIIRKNRRKKDERITKETVGRDGMKE